MTSKTITSTKTERDFEPFPEHPPRDDMQNWIHLNQDGKGAALVTHIGDRETTTTGSEVPIGPTLANRRDHRIPDFMVSKNSKPWLTEEDGGYAIDRQGKPPDFVLEIASRWTGVIDYTEKREDYARYGIPEYWRFDSTQGEYHDVALPEIGWGDDGQYEPIEVERLGESRFRGYSEALEMYVCWEYGELRFYDPASGSYMSTQIEDIAERRAEYARAEREAAARRVAEEAQREAEARAAEAEAEIRRLRERLAKLDDSE